MGGSGVGLVSVSSFSFNVFSFKFFNAPNLLPAFPTSGTVDCKHMESWTSYHIPRAWSIGISNPHLLKHNNPFGRDDSKRLFHVGMVLVLQRATDTNTIAINLTMCEYHHHLASYPSITMHCNSESQSGTYSCSHTAHWHHNRSTEILDSPNDHLLLRMILNLKVVIRLFKPFCHSINPIVRCGAVHVEDCLVSEWESHRVMQLPCFQFELVEPRVLPSCDHITETPGNQLLSHH